MDFGRIAFGVRCGKPDPVFFQSWTHFLASGTMRQGDAVLIPAVELPHHWSANVLVNQFMKHTTCDTLMLFDDDMQFTPEQVIAMRDNPDNFPFGVVQALCCMRKPPHSPIVIEHTEDGLTKHIVPTEASKTHEVGLAGLAFTLIRRSTFEAVQGCLDNPGMYFAWGGNGMGEDATFCELVTAADIKIGIDTTVAISHRCTVGIEFDIVDGKTKMHAYENPGFRELVAAVNENMNKEAE